MFLEGFLGKSRQLNPHDNSLCIACCAKLYLATEPPERSARLSETSSYFLLQSRMYATIIRKPGQVIGTTNNHTTPRFCGNWFEDRLQYLKQKFQINSTNGIDYPRLSYRPPDVITRRKCLQKSEGLPKEMLLDHHRTSYSDNYITWQEKSRYS